MVMDGESMKVTKKDVEDVAVLSRLAIPEEEKEQYTEQLNAFLEYVDNLSAVPTDDIKPTAHVLQLSNVFREDVVKPSLGRELALSNAPLKEDGYFKVPKILED
jgi:aspartyl-tRNA(Asn)/glutamyl-tRNA(Gln) amidotransferase subunit C